MLITLFLSRNTKVNVTNVMSDTDTVKPHFQMATRTKAYTKTENETDSEHTGNIAVIFAILSKM